MSTISYEPCVFPPIPPVITGQPVTALLDEPQLNRKAGWPQKQAQKQEQNRETILLTHLPQVRLIAENIRSRIRFPIEVDDLIGYGVLGLMKAVERFDPSRGILLKTYAEHRIRGAILDGLRGMDWVSRSIRQKEREYQEKLHWAGDPSVHSEAEEFQEKAGPKTGGRGYSPPTLPVQIVYAGWNLEDLEDMVEKAHLQEAGSKSANNPSTLFEHKEMRTRLARAISHLPRRNRKLLYLYYYRELSMKQIGRSLKVHESRVSQLHALTIERLRYILAGPRKTKHLTVAKDKKSSQQPPGKPSKYRVTACRSSSVSTPMVSVGVSAR